MYDNLILGSWEGAVSWAVGHAFGSMLMKQMHDDLQTNCSSDVYNIVVGSDEDGKQ